MSDKYVSRKGVRSEIYPKSSGQNATDEGQIPLPFTWRKSADKKTTRVCLKDGYQFDLPYASAIVEDADSTQAEFATGTLTDVAADAGDYLRLAESDVLSFDGTDDYVESAEYVDIVGKDHTILMWINYNTLPSSTKAIYGQGNSRNQAWYNGTILRVHGLDSGGTLHYGDTSFSPAVGEWHSIGHRFNNNTGEINSVIDGIVSGDLTNTATRTVDNLKFNIGKSTFNGLISEVRIYNRVLTETEIQADMHNRLTGSETGLVAYYKLDEGSGSTATDSAGSNDGTINGASWTTSPLYFTNSDEDNNRISPNLDLDSTSITSVSASSISWTTTTPANTAVTIETRSPEDNGRTWGSWQTATSGSSVPGISADDDLTNYVLQVRQTLSTTDITTTPTLEQLRVVVRGCDATCTSIFDVIADIAWPIGTIYTQPPGIPDPSELFTGTWDNISADYAGDFFRVEGGNALAYGGGEQLDQMQRLTGRTGASVLNTSGAKSYANGVFSIGGTYGDGGGYDTAAYQNFDSGGSPNARVSGTTDGETRPVNQTVRVWKRIS